MNGNGIVTMTNEEFIAEIKAAEDEWRALPSFTDWSDVWSEGKRREFTGARDIRLRSSVLSSLRKLKESNGPEIPTRSVEVKWAVKYPSGDMYITDSEQNARQEASETNGELLKRPVGSWSTPWEETK